MQDSSSIAKKPVFKCTSLNSMKFHCTLYDLPLIKLKSTICPKWSQENKQRNPKEPHQHACLEHDLGHTVYKVRLTLRSVSVSENDSANCWLYWQINFWPWIWWWVRGLTFWLVPPQVFACRSSDRTSWPAKISKTFCDADKATLSPQKRFKVMPKLHCAQLCASSHESLIEQCWPICCAERCSNLLSRRVHNLCSDRSDTVGFRDFSC